GIRTEASNRYEHEITSELALLGMDVATALVVEIAGGKNTEVASRKDEYAKPEKECSVKVTLSKINSVLGSELSQKQAEDILKRFEFDFEPKDSADDTEFNINIPCERLDLRIAEDIVEEIGRVYGYDNIPESLPGDMDFSPKVNKLFYYIGAVRNTLIDEGFSEVETYTFTDNGELEIENPLAIDKNFARAGLSEKLSLALELNAKNVDLVGVDNVKIFEIGTVFEKDGEHTSLGIAFRNPKVKKSKAKEKEFVEDVLKILSDKFKVSFSGKIAELEDGGAVVEMNLDKLVEKLPEPKTYDDIFDTKVRITKYTSFSVYPFIVRDIAVFVPENIDKEEVKKILKEKGSELLVREPRQFDEYRKEFEDGKVKIS
ncbi:MAG: hypothetical protein KAI72_07735, partial [Candidatus Pacebacteria bacterium]|nr:hypothetical protein [Candidatus Paceibacterota bacterium]